MKRFFQRLYKWELWPFYLIYAPLGFVWVYYAIKARAFWFFSPVNPTLEFSGFEGESKREMYEQLPQELFPKTAYVPVSISADEVIAIADENEFAYPLAVKPDIGMQGLMFRKIEDKAALLRYHEHCPVDYVIQDLVDLPIEYSVFHIRYPGEEKGMVTGFIEKVYLQVKGDGRSTLRQLIEANPKASFRMDEMIKRHGEKFDDVIPAGQPYYLSIAGNHNRGARFINLHNEIDEKLCHVFDDISKKAGSFYYGRYDLKCTSLEDLKDGRNISILEYNGAGAEPNHIYDCNMSYWNALKVIAVHWKHMYMIGKINNRKGVRYWGFFEGRNYLARAGAFFTVLSKYDLSY
ncbi:MAG: hypothetical protein JWN76_182 [Chitinophagaceae bacterium]|nr:hypothetical protein [Chitinophagaceae bacterium]